MKKRGLILLILLSYNMVIGMDHIQELRDKVTQLQGELKSKYVYPWFGVAIALMVASKYMMDHSVALEKELKEKWFWNPVTEKEELPEGTDEPNVNFWYWSSIAAAGISPFPLIGGMVQWLNTLIIRGKIRILEQTIQDEEAHRQRREQYQFWEELLRNLGGQRPTPEPAAARSAASYQYTDANLPLPDHYETLGVSSTVSLDEIKKAYRKLSLRYHPDKNPSGAAKFKEISHAFDIVGNDETRPLYDGERRFRGFR